MTIDQFSAEQIEIEAHARDVIRQFVKGMDELLASDNPKVNRAGVLRDNMRSLVDIGIITWMLERDAPEVKHCLELAAESGLKGLRFPKERRSLMDMAEEATCAIECALAACDIGMAKEQAQLVPKPADYRLGHPTARWYAGVLKSALLDDKQSETEYLAELSKSTRKPPYQLLGRMYEALLHKDVPAVESEFKAYVGWFRKKVKPKANTAWTPEWGWRTTHLVPQEFILSIPGLAFSNFAASKGIKIEVDEPFLPRELLAY